jgi:ankyrin repeat protein
LHYTAIDGLDITRKLLNKGANPNAKDTWCYTPLHIIVREGHKAVVELLISHWAEIVVRASDGETPLWRARQNRHNNVVDLLKKHREKE